MQGKPSQDSSGAAWPGAGQHASIGGSNVRRGRDTGGKRAAKAQPLKRREVGLDLQPRRGHGCGFRDSYVRGRARSRSAALKRSTRTAACQPCRRPRPGRNWGFVCSGTEAQRHRLHVWKTDSPSVCHTTHELNSTLIHELGRTHRWQF